jgi:hypothetical protein
VVGVEQLVFNLLSYNFHFLSIFVGKELGIVSMTSYIDPMSFSISMA